MTLTRAKETCGIPHDPNAEQKMTSKQMDSSPSKRNLLMSSILAGSEVPAMLQTAKLCFHLGVNSSTIWRWIRERNFPKPIEVGRKTRMWKTVEVEAWLNQQTQKEQI